MAVASLLIYAEHIVTSTVAFQKSITCGFYADHVVFQIILNFLEVCFLH